MNKLKETSLDPNVKKLLEASIQKVRSAKYNKETIKYELVNLGNHYQEYDWNDPEKIDDVLNLYYKYLENESGLFVKEDDVFNTLKQQIIFKLNEGINGKKTYGTNSDNEHSDKISFFKSLIVFTLDEEETATVAAQPGGKEKGKKPKSGKFKYLWKINNEDNNGKKIMDEEDDQIIQKWLLGIYQIPEINPSDPLKCKTSGYNNNIIDITDIISGKKTVGKYDIINTVIYFNNFLETKSDAKTKSDAEDNLKQEVIDYKGKLLKILNMIPIVSNSTDYFENIDEFKGFKAPNNGLIARLYGDLYNSDEQISNKQDFFDLKDMFSNEDHENIRPILRKNIVKNDKDSISVTNSAKLLDGPRYYTQTRGSDEPTCKNWINNTFTNFDDPKFLEKKAEIEDKWRSSSAEYPEDKKNEEKENILKPYLTIECRKCGTTFDETSDIKFDENETFCKTCCKDNQMLGSKVYKTLKEQEEQAA